MNFSNTIKRYLLVRDDEWSLVIRLFTFEFLQGVSIALLFTSTLSLFLSHYPAEDLPQVFILAAALMWLAGIVYNRLEHRLNERQLTLCALLFNAASILLIRLALSFQPAYWFYFLALAWFNVAYLLNNLEFWGLASILFDVRQSKRLFGVVSAGDIPAKFIGYLAASGYIAAAHNEVLATQNLLWIALATSAISFFLFWRLHISGLLEIHIIPQERKFHVSHESLLEKIKKHPLIFNVVLVSLLTLCSYLITNFLLYGYVEKAMESNASLTLFIALFMGVSRGITLLLKLIFAGRLLDRFGFRTALLIAPTAILIACAALFITSPSGSALLIWFGGIAILLDALRSSIQSPILLAAMQPLPVHDRMSGHTIMKGLTDPLAFFLIGILLLLIVRFDAQVNYTLYASILVLIACGWWLTVWQVQKNYLRSLTSALRDRNISGEEIPFDNKETIRVLKEKLQSGSTADAAFVLHLIKEKSFAEKTELIKLGLQHPSAIVRKQALSFLPELSSAESKQTLLDFLNKETNESLLAWIITHYESALEESRLNSFAENGNDTLKSAALVALYKRNPEKWRLATQQLLKTYGHSSSDQKKFAVYVIRQTRNKEWFSTLADLLQDNDKSVVFCAIDALGHLQDDVCIQLLCDLLSSGKHSLQVKQALINCGSSALPSLSKVLHCLERDKDKELVVSIVGKMKQVNALLQLESWCEAFPQLHLHIFQALHENSYHANDESPLKKWISYYLTEAASILFMIQRSDSSNNKILADALQLDLKTIRKKLLFLFSFFYNSEIIDKAMTGFEFDTRESNSNALELIENEVEKTDARFFCSIFEASPVLHRCQTLTRNFGFPDLSEEKMLNDLMNDEFNISNWTKASYFYTHRDKNNETWMPLLQKFSNAADPVLKETVTFLLNSLMRTQPLANPVLK